MNECAATRPPTFPPHLLVQLLGVLHDALTRHAQVLQGGRRREGPTHDEPRHARAGAAVAVHSATPHGRQLQQVGRVSYCRQDNAAALTAPNHQKPCSETKPGTAANQLHFCLIAAP